MEIKVSHRELKEVEIVDRYDYLCDLCEKPFHRMQYSRDTSKVIFREGSSYPDSSGNYEEDSAYFCPECSPKVKTKLEELGVKFTHTEKDW